MVSLENIAMFNEKELETKISYSDTSSGEIVTEKFVVKLNGNLIRNIKLNDERIEYFLNHYDKDSKEYNYAFKDKYKKYKKKKKILKHMQSKWQEQEIIIEVLPKKQCQGFMLMC